MAYDFQGYLEAVDTNWYEDDPLLARLLDRYAPAAHRQAADALHAWGATCAGRLNALADESARPENAPALRHFDAHDQRVDEVVLPAATREAMAEIEGRQRLGAVHGDPFVHYAKCYRFAQNGEAGVGCSVACTDGMIRALEALGDKPIHRDIIAEVRGSTAESFAHGAQFVTEKQGGSDVPANTLRATPDGDFWRLSGQKWFCSNITADYFMITARPDGAPEGSRGVGLFVAPAYLEGRRNGYTIDRIKDKLGTRELPTAEVTFDGARAFAVGPLDRGIANVLAHVLVTSRVACAQSSAAFLRRAERVAEAYTSFRTAFGSHLIDFPLVADQLDGVRATRARSLAAIFELVRMWERARTAGKGTNDKLDFRYLVSLSKAVLTADATQQIHAAMMLVGGNGIEERFAPLPRLLRDAVIMETWEGPHNLLMSQGLKDMVRFGVDPAAFVARVAGEARADLADELGQILGAAEDARATVPYAAWAEKLVRAFGERVLAEVG